MKRNLKKNGAITLIALVITIIVLIILAGVSINLVLGNDGIIAKAKLAKENMEIAQREEEEMLNTLTNYIENEGKIVIEGPIAGGSYDNPYIPVGFTHTEGEGTWNSGYVIKETATGNVFVWVPCVLQENANQIKDGDNVQIFKKTLPTPKEDGTLDTTDPYYMYNKNDYTITGDESLANEIRTSVGKHGGFYIAAYEAGVPLDNNGNEIAPTSATTSQKARSVSGATVWTNITRTNAIAVAEKMITTTSDGVKSGLISGECWDTTLQWMVNSSTNATMNIGYDTKSTGKGWYKDESYNSNTSSYIRHTTGYYAVNNIYDMAGNIGEWTTENCTDNGNGSLVNRGGNYFCSGSGYPAAVRRDYSDNTNDIVGLRVVLYKNG